MSLNYWFCIAVLQRSAFADAGTSWLNQIHIKRRQWGSQDRLCIWSKHQSIQLSPDKTFRWTNYKRMAKGFSIKYKSNINEYGTDTLLTCTGRKEDSDIAPPNIGHSKSSFFTVVNTKIFALHVYNVEILICFLPRGLCKILYYRNSALIL